MSGTDARSVTVPITVTASVWDLGSGSSIKTSNPGLNGWLFFFCLNDKDDLRRSNEGLSGPPFRTWVSDIVWGL